MLYSILKYHLNKKKLGVKNGELNSSQLHLRHHNNFYTIWELRDLHKRQELNIIHYGLLRRLLGPNSTLAINTNMDVPTTILSLQSFVELKNAMLPKRYLNHGPWIRFLCQWINPHPIPKNVASQSSWSPELSHPIIISTYTLQFWQSSTSFNVPPPAWSSHLPASLFLQPRECQRWLVSLNSCPSSCGTELTLWQYV